MCCWMCGCLCSLLLFFVRVADVCGGTLMVLLVFLVVVVNFVVYVRCWCLCWYVDCVVCVSCCCCLCVLLMFVVVR